MKDLYSFRLICLRQHQYNMFQNEINQVNEVFISFRLRRGRFILLKQKNDQVSSHRTTHTMAAKKDQAIIMVQCVETL